MMRFLVAYQYFGGQVYQVGEFGDGVDATVVTVRNGCFSSNHNPKFNFKNVEEQLTNVKKSSVNLMMKNIYQIPSLSSETGRF
jgi:cell surface protein SprA